MSKNTLLKTNSFMPKIKKAQRSQNNYTRREKEQICTRKESLKFINIRVKSLDVNSQA